MVLGALGILNFMFMLLIDAVMNFGTVFPGVVGTLLFVIGLLQLTNRGRFLTVKNVFLKRIGIAAIVIFVISFVMIQAIMLFSIRTDQDVEVDYLVILGGGLKDDQIPLTVRNRLDKGLEFIEKYPDIKVIVTGGQGRGQTITEAEAMERYLMENNISADRIIKEERATSTMENFKYSKAILEKLTGRSDYKVMVVTNGFHLFRAKVLAERNGFEPYGMPARTNPYLLANHCIREYFAIIKSYLFDR